jgi:hypothetical protein
VLQVCEVLILQDWVLYIPSCSSHGQEADRLPWLWGLQDGR